MNRAPKSILAIGAHSDDIEIGAGGTLRRVIEEVPDIRIHWVVLAAAGTRESEARGSASNILTSEKHHIETQTFRDGFFPYDGAQIKEYFETLKRSCDPDVIFTHHRDDLHQDHRLVSELTWNSFRNHLILEYEIPKYDGGLGSPNMFVPLPPRLVDTKIRDLMQHFGTQRNKDWFTEDTFRGLLRIRGIECRSPTGLAEAFYCRKAILEF